MGEGEVSLTEGEVVKVIAEHGVCRILVNSKIWHRECDKPLQDFVPKTAAPLKPFFLMDALFGERCAA